MMNPSAWLHPHAASGRQPRVVQGALLTLLVMAVAVLTDAVGLLPRLEWLASDFMQQIDARLSRPRPDLRFVVLDQRSLEAGEKEFGLSWPWPRESYAHALHFLRAAGARQVILDFIYTEPSFYGPDDDRLLAEAMAASNNVYLPVLIRDSLAGPARHPFSNTAGERRWITPQSLRTAAPDENLLLPIEPLRSAAQGLGEANFRADADGVIRRVRPFTQIPAGSLPALGLAPRVDTKTQINSRQLKLGPGTLPLDAGGHLVLKFPGSWENYPTYSLIDLITSHTALTEGEPPTVPLSAFRDTTVIIGSTAAALLDLRKTPLAAQTPGFFVSAAVWSAAEGGVYSDQKTRAWLWLWVALLAGLGVVFGRHALGQGLGWLGLTLAGYWGLAALAFFGWHWLPAWIGPPLALGVAYGASLGLSYRKEQNQKKIIQGAFSQVLSPQILDKLMQDPQRLAVGGETALISVYFSDLQGFTSLSEKIPAKTLVAILNDYLGDMIETIVDEQDGYVDKLIGDAVMAFWGAPLPDEHHAGKACAAAWRNQEKMQAINERLKSLGVNEPLRMRIGIHTGPAIVGMMGSPKKLNYTVMGDTVNLASRLEGVNKEFGTRILVSEETARLAGPQALFREIDRIRVKGKAQPTRIYELAGYAAPIRPEQAAGLDAYQHGVDHYFSGRFKEAEAWFKKAGTALPGDQPSRVMLKRCRKFQKSPPPADWDGVTTLKKK